MKRGKKLLILLASLVAVSLAAWGISAIFAPDTTGTPMNSGETVFTLEGIKNLSWTYGENEISFDISGESWVYTAGETYQISETAQADILKQITEIKAKKVIEQPDALSAYGLAEPECVIQADDTVISIGDALSVGSQRYLSLGDGKVYLVTDQIIYPFQNSLLEMIQLEDLPDLTNITAMTITTETESMALVSNPADHTDYTDSYTWYLKETDGYSRVSQDVVAGLLVYLEDLSFTGCADYHVQDLATYGLDVPAATYNITYTTDEGTDTLTLMVGDGNDDGVFVMQEGSNRVYLVDETSGSVMAQMSRDAFYCTDVIRVAQEELQSVEILLNGETYLIEKTTLTGTEDSESTGWGLGDRQVEITDILDSLTALAGKDGTDVSTAGLTQELQLIFHRANDSLTLTFYRYDGTNCLSVLNDEAPMLVPRTDVVDIIEQINAIVLN